MRRWKGTTVTLGSGRVLEGDAVVAGLGIVPNVELAEAAGLAVDNGIVVDELGRAGGRDDVFAAGDVANYPSSVLGKRFRVEHEDHANSHGRAVGANMAGASEPYEHLPFFYSDIFDLGYEAVGEVDSRLATVEEWEEPNRKGVITYVDEERRPRGFLLWDTWGKVDDARERIRSGEPVRRRSPAWLAHSSALASRGSGPSSSASTSIARLPTSSCSRCCRSVCLRRRSCSRRRQPVSRVPWSSAGAA